jgi:hypothetical protein
MKNRQRIDKIKYKGKINDKKKAIAVLDVFDI